MTCSVETCGTSTYSKGLCRKHHTRLLRHGDPLVVLNGRDAPGSASAKWRGDDVTYRTVHSRLVAERGSADRHACVDCGKSARQWSYTGESPVERFARPEIPSHPYSPDLSYYVPRCRPCHTAFDVHARATPCVIEGCDARAVSNGMCGPHVCRWRRRGRPEITAENLRVRDGYPRPRRATLTHAVS